MLALVITVVSFPVAVSANDNNIDSTTSNQLTAQKIEEFVGETLSADDIQIIQDDISNLETCKLDLSSLTKIEKNADGYEYILHYSNIYDTLKVSNRGDNIQVITNDGINSNELLFYDNGDLYLDGTKIVVETQVITAFNEPEPKGVIWKSVKSLSPLNGLSAMDYTDYLASGKQNIQLGVALDELTASALSLLLANFQGYEDMIESLIDVAFNILNVLKAVNAKSYHIGCYYQTYTHGPYDYKYYNRFYANQECTGTYRLELSYEHFTVY